MIYIKRTHSATEDFKTLVSLLDQDIHSKNYKAQSEYDTFNKIDPIDTVVIAYDNEQPVGCGCFKVFDEDTIEIKRMFVRNEYRGKRISKKILHELETWSKNLGYKRAVLETGSLQQEAIGLYLNSGYKGIPNYGPYRNMQNSLCFEKKLI
jgi:putative acetyltransferase